jgi:CubicO group peptidase (beta-lactamase class C family)
VRSLNTGLPVDKHTLFGIASNSKAFTAFALVFWLTGKISWDDKVRKWIPEFRMYNPYVTRRIYHPRPVTIAAGWVLSRRPDVFRLQ